MGTTYDILKKEARTEIMEIVNKFDLPDRKNRKKIKIFIPYEEYTKPTKADKKEAKKTTSLENQNKDENLNLPNLLIFNELLIEDIRRNLNAIILYAPNKNNKENAEKKKLNDDIKEASKYNEIDIISTNEIISPVAFKNMKKNFISLCFSFSEILKCRGIQRAKKLNIMKKNLKMAKKYKVNYIISTFANNIFEYRAPEALMSFGKILGMSKEECKDSISKNFENILRKVSSRNDEKILMNGLEILKFGSVKKEKKKYGYY